MNVSKVSKNLGFNIDLSDDLKVTFFGSIDLGGASISPYASVSLSNLLDQKIRSLFIGACFYLPIGCYLDEETNHSNLPLLKLSKDVSGDEARSGTVLDPGFFQKIQGVFKGKFEWNALTSSLNDSKLEFIKFRDSSSIRGYSIGCRSLKEPFSSSYVRLFFPVILDLPKEPNNVCDNITAVFFNIFPGNFTESTLEIDLFKKVQNDFVKIWNLTSKFFDPKDLVFKVPLPECFFDIGVGDFNPELKLKSKDLLNFELNFYNPSGFQGNLKPVEIITKALKNHKQGKIKQALKEDLNSISNMVQAFKEQPSLNQDGLKKLAVIKSLFETFQTIEASDKKLETLNQIQSFCQENRKELISLIANSEKNRFILAHIIRNGAIIENYLQGLLKGKVKLSEEEEMLKTQLKEVAIALQEVCDSSIENEKYILNEESLNIIGNVSEFLGEVNE